MERKKTTDEMIADTWALCHAVERDIEALKRDFEVNALRQRIVSLEAALLTAGFDPDELLTT